MDPLTTLAASALRARMESLEMLANNLANAETGGFKADREFYGLYTAPEALDAPEANPPAALPVIERPWTDFSQGTIRSTGNPLDLAITGRGFFGVHGPGGPLYTRNGSMRLSASGVLETARGHALRAAGGGVIQARSPDPIEVRADGSVIQSGQALGTLEVLEFTDPAALVKQGASYFRSGRPGEPPAPAGALTRGQGRLESSNVTSAEGAVRLVSVMRQFEMLQKAVSLGAEMNRRAVEEVARVGS